MKKIFTLIVALIVLNVNAQTWFVVPDAAFVNYLHNNLPNAMQSDSLNTSSTLVTGASSLNLASVGISNLNGIQYFTSLTYLDCSGNTFTNLPALPNTLTYLDCSYNSHLGMLPATLPPLLQTLYCENDSLSSLPALPASLQNLWCYSNLLTTLPALPTSLQNLYCFDNGLTSLPALNNGLLQLNCYINALTALPALPNTLTYLDCHANAISTLSSLGTSLAYMYASSNAITTLPALPTSLLDLDCSYNNLTTLPTLPAGLSILDCSYNYITNLPALPQLSQFYCDSNNITCFPIFPNSIQEPVYSSCIRQWIYYINISSNPATCVPNYVAGMGADSTNYQKCAAGNINGCAIATGIKELTNSKYQVSVYPNPASNNFQVSLTDNIEGNLSIYDVNGKLVLSQIINNNSIDVSGLPEGVYNISITSSLNTTGINKKLVIVK
jgi:Leucine-rich repeat (LRR) protein